MNNKSLLAVVVILLVGIFTVVSINSSKNNALSSLLPEFDSAQETGVSVINGAFVQNN